MWGRTPRVCLKEDKTSFALGEGDSPVGGRKRNLSVLVQTWQT